MTSRALTVGVTGVGYKEGDGSEKGVLVVRRDLPQ